MPLNVCINGRFHEITFHIKKGEGRKIHFYKRYANKQNLNNYKQINVKIYVKLITTFTKARVKRSLTQHMLKCYTYFCSADFQPEVIRNHNFHYFVLVT